MSRKLLNTQLEMFLKREITVAVGEDLITGTLEAVKQDFLILTESINTYERESITRIIVLSQISYIQVPL
ncbi:hypothetical protein MKY07_17395 [Solibacillus sp. FSL W7-1472]|uniref:DUF2642 domain-containing protein n=2 Tax=Solibacillus TaxID=648800 RepID=F2F8P4_SOLSS|nr:MULTISPECIES: hypothetical protein [Solibacillus]AMO86991.1 hypothetical protein SOLI23_15950 [Solibacillus silvestris]EKB45420.1 hypothetical protein B857_01694 [Solibacillus isronensis B3W22]BAK14985.1 hypothetical protein SSIL_0562 [Solibacillus silvestris StLB046]